MGKTVKKNNHKVKQLNRSQTLKQITHKNISVNIDIEVDQTKYDSSNPLVLISKSSKSKNNKNVLQKKTNLKTKVLSKKQRKKLEKVLERKKKKTNRTKLLNDLQELKAGDKEYALMSSTSEVQTFGRKRIDYLRFNNTINEDICETHSYKSNRRKKFRKLENKPVIDKDLNIVGISDEDISEDETDSDDEETGDKPEDSCLSETNLKVPQMEENDCKLDDKKHEINVELNISKDVKNETSSNALIKKIENIKSTFVTINRSPEIEKCRSGLPIVSEEHVIMDAVLHNPIIIISGETGSGKTTQVPQFLYEAGYANHNQMIAITEPRRVAAIAMSKRVAQEMNLSTDMVSYQIRFDGNVSEKTRIKFMTDGVLLKEIQNDFLLTKYSVIIIDEAHERSLYSDILIGLLSRIVPLRIKKENPLKLIIMSATLRVEDFTSNTRLFKIVPPVLKIDSRQYPVSVHFNKKTNNDYLHEAFKKVCKIHSELPVGGILVFVTGRQDVQFLCRKLKAKFPHNSTDTKSTKTIKIRDKRIINKQKQNQNNNSSSDRMPTINLDDYDVNPIERERILDDFDYSDDESDAQFEQHKDEEEDFYKPSQPLYCLPLYSMLPHAKQSLIFRDSPPNARLCIISTNVAETSLTIPNIKYVVDTGKVKCKVYDNVTGISTFIICWTSKASADQRAGRAGRTGPGHCYRLYSSAIFNDEFPQFSEPEIIRKPADDLLLQMKAMNIENVVNFPFPSQPSKEALVASEKRLILMEALKEVDKKTKDECKAKITPLGKAMSTFPISPRYAKMLALSRQQELMPYTIAIVSALTIQEIFVNNNAQRIHSNEMKKKQYLWSGDIKSLLLGDVMVLLNAVGASEFAGLSQKFCEQNKLRYNAIIEIHKLRLQLTSQVNQLSNDSNDSNNLNLNINPPNELQIKLLRQIVLSGFFDHISKKIPDFEIDNEGQKTRIKNAYQSLEVESPVFISPDSVLKDEMPEYVVYQEIFETSRLNMRNVVAIEPEWLPVYVPKLCTFSNPLDTPSPRYESSSDSIKCYRSCTFGPHAWPIPPTELDYPSGLEKYKLFAKLLLEGEIIPFFKTYSKLLLSPPSIITKTWASLQPRTQKLLKSLIHQNIDRKRDLITKWKSDQEYLLKEYIEWLPNTYHSKVKTSWPPI